MNSESCDMWLFYVSLMLLSTIKKFVLMQVEGNTVPSICQLSPRRQSCSTQEVMRFVSVVSLE